MTQGITNVDGKLYKKATVVMIPSENNEGAIYKNINTDEPNYGYKIGALYTNPSSFAPEPQHLYFVEDGLAKKGEYFLAECFGGGFRPLLVGNCSVDAKRIIASTDPDLKLPRPSNAFIQSYCKQGGINQVLIHLTWSADKQWIGHTARKNYRPRVAKDNTITVKPIKEIWNREELKEVVIRAHSLAITSPQIALMDWFNENF